MPTVNRDKIKIYYEEQGEGDPVILIHDLFESHLDWAHLQQKLSKHFRVIVIDLRGSGESSSPKAPFTIEDLADDVIHLADHLNLETFHLVGDSMGGSVAQKVASKYPKRVNHLVLGNSFLKISEATSWFLDMIADMLKEGMSQEEVYRHMMPWFFSSRFLEYEDDVHKMLQVIKKRKHPLTYTGFRHQLDALKAFDGTTGAKKITAKTLFIVAEEDLFCLFKESRSLINKVKDHQVELCPGGHKSKLECSTRYMEVIENFLK